MSIAKFSVKQPVLVNMAFIIVIVIGLFLMFTMPREIFPSISFNYIIITTVYPGVSPEEMEKLVTIPIENQIQGIDEIEDIRSVSQESMSIVYAKIYEYVDDDDMYKIRQDIQSEVNRVENFPDDAEDPVVTELVSEQPICTLSLGSDLDELAVRDIAKAMRDDLTEIDGISSVTMLGVRDREIWVDVNPNKLNGYQLSMFDVINAIKNQNLNIPAGNMRSATDKMLVRTIGEFEDASGVEDVIIRSTPGGQQVRVSDVAAVQETFEERTTLGRLNGLNAVNLLITRQEDADILDLVEQIKEYMARKQEQFGDRVTLTITNDMSHYVKNRLNTLRNNGLIGLLLVVITLYIFLDFRMALMTALGLPVALFATLIIMNAMGISINMLSMFSMIVVIGMLVDDGIVVVENVYRHLQMGKDRITAAIVGTQEVMWPVICAIATTVAAFLPMLLMTGIMGKFMGMIPKVVSIALVASLFEALIILPSHMADFAKPGHRKKEVRWQWRFFEWMRGYYLRLLSWSLRRRYFFSIGMVVVAIICIAYAIGVMRVVLFDMNFVDRIFVLAETQQNTPVEETARRLEQVEAVAAALPPGEVESYITYAGQQQTNELRESGEHLGQVTIALNDHKLLPRSGLEILADVRKQIAGISGFVKLQVEEFKGGPPVGKKIEVRVLGEDFTVIKQIADELQAYLHSIDGPVDISDDFKEGTDELQVTIDKNRATLYGLDVARVGTTIRAMVDGIEATQIRRSDEDVDVIVRFAEEFRQYPEQIRDLRVVNLQGDLIPFSNFASFARGKGYDRINRYNRKRSITVSADIETVDVSFWDNIQRVINGQEPVEQLTASSAAEKIREQFSDLGTRFPGYTLSFGGEEEELQKSFRSLLHAFAIAFLLIYMILASLFKSFLKPFIVMFAVPFAFIGVVIGLIIMNEPISLMAFIGIVALTGIVVNDSLILVDFINVRRRLGHAGRWRSIVLAGKTRLRPVLLTTITTVCGLLPLALTTEGQAAFLAPMAIAIVWGISFATLLTLVVIPCIYAIADDIMIKVFRREWR